MDPERRTFLTASAAALALAATRSPSPAAPEGPRGLPPPFPMTLPWAIVSPDSAALAPLLTWKTPTESPPLMVSRLAPGPLTVVCPPVSPSVRVLARVIVCGVLKTLPSKAIVSSPTAVS